MVGLDQQSAPKQLINQVPSHVVLVIDREAGEIIRLVASVCLCVCLFVCMFVCMSSPVHLKGRSKWLRI